MKGQLKMGLKIQMDLSVYLNMGNRLIQILYRKKPAVNRIFVETSKMDFYVDDDDLDYRSEYF